ncbi:MAG TPA: alpha/beta hydrolase [Mycobacteriales bacterium]|nr:alpha/beta hydrolase [Mycobacteriales bacterium]
MSTQTLNAKNLVVNSVVIGAPADRVWRSCTDIESWPRIFPTCREIRRTVIGADEVIMDMRVSNGLGDSSVRSHRRYHPAQLRIEFEMLTLPPTIAAMDGVWTVEPVSGGARLVVVHNFVPVEDAGPGAAVLSDTLHQTTERVLTELRGWVEADRDIVAEQDAGPDQDAVAGQETSGEGLRDAWGPRTAANGISAATFESCELFFSRLGLIGLDWGDITMALKDVRKASTHEDWADWHRKWSALGVHYEGRATEAFAAGYLETGRVAIRRATACHHVAEFFYFDDPEVKNASRARVTEVFDRGLPYLRETVRPLSIPYQGMDLPGYLMTPPGPGPWPCVVLVNGLDSAKEVELHSFARELIARGMGAVVFDGPGQGLLIGRMPMVVEFEQVVAAVVTEIGRHPEVDSDRLGIFGVSFGGYLAARAAATVPGFQACVNLSGGFDHDSFDAVNVMVKKDFRYVFGLDDDDAMLALCRNSLHLRDIPPLTIPLLAIHGELDSIIPIESCERMLDWATGECELIRYPGERHVATNYFGDFIPRFCDWLATRLGVVAA